MFLKKLRICCFSVFFFIGLSFCSAAIAQTDPSEFTYESLQSLINSENLTTIPQVLERLPGPLMGSYLLFHHNQALQAASYEFPKIVLFGQDAKLIVSFNGDPLHKGYPDIELFQFRDETKSFEMRIISFTDHGVTFSAANPPLCISCHGDVPRPLWSSYPNWPLAYGAFHETLSPAEKAGLESFLAIASSDDRYRYLTDIPHFNTTEHQHRPNTRFGRYVGRLQAQQISNLILQSPVFQKNSSMVLDWFLNCPGTRTTAYLNQLEKMLQAQFPPNSFSDLYRDYASVEGISAKEAFILEKVLTGLKVYTWNLAKSTLPKGARYDSGESNIDSGSTTIDQLVGAQLFRKMKDLKPQLQPFYKEVTFETTFNALTVPVLKASGYDIANPYEYSVKPGGIGDFYDALGIFYDRNLALGACGK